MEHEHSVGCTETCWQLGIPCAIQTWCHCNLCYHTSDACWLIVFHTTCINKIHEFYLNGLLTSFNINKNCQHTTTISNTINTQLDSDQFNSITCSLFIKGPANCPGPTTSPQQSAHWPPLAPSCCCSRGCASCCSCPCHDLCVCHDLCPCHDHGPYLYLDPFITNMETKDKTKTNINKQG